MNHIELIDGNPIEAKQVKISKEAVTEIYKKMGINVVIQSRIKPIKRQSKAQEPYVRTIPLSWICQATGLPGKALAVGLVIWYFSGVTKSKTVKLTRLRLSHFGLLPETSRRGLRALEKAKLVDVERSGKKKSPGNTSGKFQ